jgi:hypothetical protein
MKTLHTLQVHPDQQKSQQQWIQHMVRWHGVAPQSALAPLTRREFLKLAGINALALGAALSFPHGVSAHGAGPKPIPGGIQPFGPGTTVYHVLLPGYPPFGSPNPAENDPSLITDFNGHVGLAYVQGMGTRTDKTTGATSRNVFEVDLRFMKGEYVGEDDRRHHGAFVLI